VLLKGFTFVVFSAQALGNKKSIIKFNVSTFCTFEVKIHLMIIERTKDQILIKISAKVDYLEYLEITSKTKAKQSDADKLANELNQAWWDKNKNSFIQ
jgi:hypothetical protein